ncbi:cytochrome P450 [Suillus subalutaceus]|uniref:cytochrome P450 n=1 Tax=Suillus subalutaceus TaxID=48586 RepID=UPI001B85D030|nr:cytochrome P450 [Suillus subalutaceus]KAG1856694.1 cytochrome P450 [Suillus subalutaceus]
MQLLLSATTCLAVLVVIFPTYRPKSKSGLPLPPSPPTWRLRGHVLPPYKPFLTVAGWIDEYGPLITIRSNFERIVIIGRYKAAVEIMENQGKFVADRPRMVAAGEMLNGGMSIALIPFGDRFRRMRRALHSHLQPKAAEAYQPVQTSHAKDIVLGVLDNPQDITHHAITYAATTIMKVAYAKNTPTSGTDPEVVEMLQMSRMVARILRPGAYLVDSIPWLKYLPWYGRELKLGFESRKKVHIDDMERVKEQMTEMAFLGGAFLSAGSVTTSASICTVLMAAACFTGEQAKVQAELDAVIGRHRAPTFADQGSLPRLQAFISEALRWRPVIPSGLPHRTTKDVIWENYCIPAGTTVFGDHWDPDVYPEPYAFKPQRWIDEQGGLRDDLKLFAYGFGGGQSVFISTLLALWAYKLTLDPTKPLEDMGFMAGSTSEVPCAFKFEKRIPETELRSMLQHYPEVV